MQLNRVSWRTAADLLTTTAILITCSSLILSGRARPKTGPLLPTVPLSIAGATVRGSSNAPVVIVEWSDYECPFCSRAERDVVPKLDELFIQPGRVQLAFRHLPLEQIHQRAAPAAQAALCAGTEGRFWEMHSALFSVPSRLDDASFVQRARDLGIDAAKFKACLAKPRDSRITNDLEAAKKLGLTGTPVFLIGLRQADGNVKAIKLLSGAKPIGDFVDVIEPLLSRPQRESFPVASASLGASLLTAGIATVLWRRRRRLNH